MSANHENLAVTKAAVRAAAKRVGGPIALADHLGISYQALYKWSRVPDGHVREIAHLSGFSLRKLRPDLYGPAPKRIRKSA